MDHKMKSISADVLNKLLANTSVLLMQTLNYHWNLKGAEFHDYHLLFDKQYNELFEHMDLIAERVRAVECQALGSMSLMLEKATLKEDKTVPAPKEMVAILLQQYEYQIAEIREAIAFLNKETDDYGSINMLEELIFKYEKTAWMLRSLLGK